MTENEWLSSADPSAMLRFLQDHHRPTDRCLRLFAVACCRAPAVWGMLADDVPCQRCDEFNAERRHDPSIGNPGHPCQQCGQPLGTGRTNRSRRAVEVAERYADGLASERERQAAFAGALDVVRAIPDGPRRILPATAAHSCEPRIRPHGDGRANGMVPELPPAAQAALLRCIAGNPLRPAAKVWAGDYCPDWLTPAARGLAQAIYTDRDWGALPVLADALEEAGCTDAAILAHLRETERPCPGCGGSGGAGYGKFGLCPRCGGSGKLPAVHCRGCWATDCVLGLS